MDVPVNDDPFRNRIGAMLTGPGGATIAIYSALMMMPLLVLWGLVEKLFRRAAPRRDDLFTGDDEIRRNSTEDKGDQERL